MDSLRIDSSRTEVCSGVEPCLVGSSARSSFSTWFDQYGLIEGDRAPYCNFKVYRLIGKRGHFIAEAEAVLAQVVRREDELALPLLVALGDDPLARGVNLVVDVERPAVLYLGAVSASAPLVWMSRSTKIDGEAYGEVKGDL